MPGFGVITNPNAGRNRRNRDRVAALRELVGDAGLVLETDGLEELDAAVVEMRRQRIDVFAVCGGDGTYFRSLTALARAWDGAPLPPFLPLRGGSMNTIARAVGYRHGTPEKVLSRAVGAFRRGENLATTWRQLIRVNGGQLGFLVGSGAVVRFLESYYARPGRGPIAAVRVAAVAIASAATGVGMARGLFERFVATVDCDGENLAFPRYSVLFAAGVAEFGLGFRVAYLADRKPGFFHVLAGDPRVSQLARRVPHLKAGWPMRVDGLYDNLAQRVSVEFATPTKYMIDGDILEPVSRLTLTAGPLLDIVQV